ncbi:unnamed protein product [Sphenostylis stenocarpa]|uniref:Uncharacterized protein n=1 Tax=Sphenostylis stenocarpa TaxID=92480 RepID=A0AA86S1Q9_9FABA|nr:unnamed protein product [Sphenostylis stenocarpa]
MAEIVCVNDTMHNTMLKYTERSLATCKHQENLSSKTTQMTVNYDSQVVLHIICNLFLEDNLLRFIMEKID